MIIPPKAQAGKFIIPTRASSHHYKTQREERVRIFGCDVAKDFIVLHDGHSSY
ncbi:MAG: hypothetical protein GXO04_05140, partial [Aquificae bacterium]|nr:hypothetical protein [Aquificota bacterium]